MDKNYITKKDMVYRTFNGWINKSIEKTYECLKADTTHETTPAMVFLLVSCAIDFIAGFYSGRDPRSSSNIGEEYKAFIRDFMSNYDADILYKDLRCAFAHNFALGAVGLTHNNPRPIHLIKTTGGLTALNFENFFNDYKDSVERYFGALDGNEELKARFLKRFDCGGILALTGADFRKSDLPEN